MKGNLKFNTVRLPDGKTMKGLRNENAKTQYWVEQEKSQENTRRFASRPDKRVLCKKLDKQLAKINKYEFIESHQDVDSMSRGVIRGWLSSMWHTVDTLLDYWNSNK